MISGTPKMAAMARMRSAFRNIAVLPCPLLLPSDNVLCLLVSPLKRFRRNPSPECLIGRFTRRGRLSRRRRVTLLGSGVTADHARSVQDPMPVSRYPGAVIVPDDVQDRHLSKGAWIQRSEVLVAIRI
jgi:hypothetical protein